MKAQDENYVVNLEKERREKDVFFTQNTQSPIKDKTKFKGLSYFKIEKQWRVKASFAIRPQVETLTIKTTTGESEKYIKYADAKFKVKEKEYKLLVLKRNPQDKTLFILFTDLSNGKTTYGGGRYIDLVEDLQKKEIIIDFNKAYNPYCAYNNDYSCPIPPKENRLDLLVEAGEKYDAK